MQQQNQEGRRFSESPQQPVYRFPQNQPVQGWQPQQSFDAAAPSNPVEEPSLPWQNQRVLNRVHRRQRRKIFTLWNLFAVIGIITVMIEALRYLIIPLLVYLNTLTGGAL